MSPESVNPSATILVVDDEDFLLEYVRIVLVRAGYTVLTATNGEEAWNLIAENRHEIRLLLTDIIMPDSFDGFELAERVRKHQPDLPVLLMTGATLRDHPAREVITRQRKLLRKPFFPDQLLTIVREHLEPADRSVEREL
ncbi:MAG TPA: response regulator [Chthoniobacterales bacterium]|jgi:DNA-binding NtrC family response regulator|nr:response regulator [Chthoniobacterales bacterium]